MSCKEENVIIDEDVIHKINERSDEQLEEDVNDFGQKDTLRKESYVKS